MACYNCWEAIRSSAGGSVCCCVCRETLEFGLTEWHTHITPGQVIKLEVSIFVETILKHPFRILESLFFTYIGSLLLIFRAGNKKTKFLMAQ